jgi:hypothetical protein
LEQVQLYGWKGGIAWLPRVTERECTSGLPWESAIGAHGAWARVLFWRGSGRGAHWTAAGTAALLIQMRYGAGTANCVVFRLRFEGARLLSRSRFQEEVRLGGKPNIMTWIKTVPVLEVDKKLRKAMEGQRALYPVEYATPVHPDESGGSSIVGSHTLIPEALYHAFGTFGALMSPELPLSRRQHEMIATMVSVTNRCVY